MGLFDIADARLASLEARVAALEGQTVEPPAPDFDPTDGTWLSVRDYGAKGDGETDDTKAIQTCIDTAKARGKVCYLPAGDYRMYILFPPSGLTVRGAGPSLTSLRTLDVVRWGTSGFYCADKSDITLEGFTLIGPVPDGHMYDDQGIYMGNSHRITIKNVWLDKWTFALRSDSGGSKVGNSDISIIGCRTLSKNTTGYLAAYTTKIRISGCDFDSDTVNTRSDGPGPSHHLYFARDVSDVVVEDITFRNGDSWSIQLYPGPNLTNMAFNRVVFENVRAGVVIQSASNITFDGVTATSNRYEPGYSWFKVNSGSNILVKNAEVWDAPIGTGFTAENVVVH